MRLSKVKDKSHSYSKINNPEFHFSTIQYNITVILAGNIHSHPISKNYSFQDDTQIPSRGTWGKYVQHLLHHFQEEKQKNRSQLSLKLFCGQEIYCCVKQSPSKTAEIQKDQKMIKLYHKHLCFMGQRLVNLEYLQDIFSNQSL